MKTWSITTVINTCLALKDEVIQSKKKNVPVYVKVIMNDGDAVIYPISSIGTNNKSVLIAVYDVDRKSQYQIKELNDESQSWLTREMVKGYK